jgi:hypothetical protein
MLIINGLVGIALGAALLERRSKSGTRMKYC